MKPIAFLVPAAILALGGCASILNDPTQPINVSTSTGREIRGTVDGMPFKAPGIVTVARNDQNKIFVTETDGCARETVAEKSVDPKFFVNLLSGGPLGSTTDYASKKMWKYNENVTISCRS